MNFRFEFEKGAEKDFWKTYDYYNNIDSDLATTFTILFEESVSQITQFPESGELVDGNYRKVLLRKYPHFIIYKILKPDLLLCLAVGHTRRKPFYWVD